MARDSRPFTRTLIVRRSRPPVPHHGPSLIGKKGRKAIWEPRALNSADYAEGMRLLKEWGRDKSSQIRIQGNFMTVCRLSGRLHTDPMAAIGTLGQMSNSGLGPGSRSTYMNYIRKKFSAAHEAAYAAGVCAADHEANHAKDIADEILWKFVQLAPVDYQPILYLMYVCGFRVKAIKFFKRLRIFLPTWAQWRERDLEITVAIDKNRKKKGMRTTLVLPSKWNYPKPPTFAAWKFLMEGDQKECLFKEVTSTKINSALRKIAKTHGLPRPTTYSFRRGYINRVLQFVETKGQLTKFTLHYDEATVEAFYRRTAKEREAMHAPN